MLRPILVTGSHRSGTTWIGNAVSLPRNVLYVQEPLNPDVRPSWLGEVAKFWYEYMPADDAKWRQIDRIVRCRYPVGQSLRGIDSLKSCARYARDCWSVVRLRIEHTGSARALVKDPFMVFNVVPFLRRYDGARVVLCVRNPVAFASSLVRLNWTFDFSNWSRQRDLMDGPLSEWADEIRFASERQLPLVDQACLMWRAIHGHMASLLDACRGSVSLVVHERFAQNAPANFEALYEWLELEWTTGEEAGIRRLTQGSSDDVKGTADVLKIDRDSRAVARAWKDRLPSDVISAIAKQTEREAARFYPDGYLS